jgi:outer membrane protein TolC
MRSIRFSLQCWFFIAVGSALVARADPAADALPRPLTLEAAVSYALTHNPELRRVNQAVAEREGVVMEATAKTRPNIGASAQVGYTEPRLFEGFPGFPDVPMPDPNAWQVDVTVRRLVYSGGGVQAQVHSAQERTEAARAAVTAAVNATIYQIEEDFLGVLLAREQIRVHEEALQVLERERERATVRQAAGAGADFEVLRAEVAIANARPALIRAQNAYHARQDALRTTLGIDAGLSDADTDLDLQGDLAVPPLKIALRQAIETARARRPELQIDARLIAAAREDINAARAGRKPQVNLVGGYEYRKATYAASLGETLNGFTLGAQLDWAIFDGKATQGRVRQAVAREAQAEAAKDELGLQIDLEVRDAHRSLGEAAQLLASARKVIEQAEESLRLAQTRLSAGTATQLDVLTAQAALTEARSNLSQAQHDYALSAARLRRAMGTATAP